jgi:tight adherence protein C
MTPLLLISLAVFALVGGVIAYFGYRTYAKPGKVLDTLVATPGTFDDFGAGEMEEARESRSQTFLQWIGEKVPVSPEEAGMTRRLLMAAGYRTDKALVIFTGVRVVVAILFLVGAILLTTFVKSDAFVRWGGIVPKIMWVVAPIMGWYLTSYGLEYLISQRQTVLRHALPDALDLLVICIEAGIGLDQAMRTVSMELALTHPEISKELNLVSVEMRAGVRRVDALRNLADRNMEPEINKLTAVMIQSDRFGTSIGEALRSHSDFMRVKRRQMAEEHANKLGIKMLIPIVFLIMPSLFIVILGPTVIRAMKELLPALNQ